MRIPKTYKVFLIYITLMVSSFFPAMAFVQGTREYWLSIAFSGFVIFIGGIFAWHFFYKNIGFKPFSLINMKLVYAFPIIPLGGLFILLLALSQLLG